MVKEQTAVHYGQVELIPGELYDGYVLNNGAVAMSEQSTAKLLGVDQETFETLKENWPPQTLAPLIGKDSTLNSILTGSSVKVVAKNSPDFGKDIIVHTGGEIESVIRIYAVASLNGDLSEDQAQVGVRAVSLLRKLMGNALDAATQEACNTKSAPERKPTPKRYRKKHRR